MPIDDGPFFDLDGEDDSARDSPRAIAVALSVLFAIAIAIGVLLS